MRFAAVLVLALSPASAFVQQQPLSSPSTATNPGVTALAAQVEPTTTNTDNNNHGLMQKLGQAALAATLCFGVLPNTAAHAIEYRLPPIDRSDPTRCTLKSSSIGQSNAQRDKLFDLRECKIAGSQAQGYDLSGVIM